jgi:hypothetical protein
MTHNLTEDDATMPERFTIPRSALERDNTLSAQDASRTIGRGQTQGLTTARRSERGAPHR